MTFKEYIFGIIMIIFFAGGILSYKTGYYTIGSISMIFMLYFGGKFLSGVLSHPGDEVDTE